MVSPLSDKLPTPAPAKTALFANAVNAQAGLPEGLAEALRKTFGPGPLKGAVFALKSEKKDQKTFFVLIADDNGNTKPLTYRMPEQRLETGILAPQAEAINAFIWKKAQSEKTPDEISAGKADEKKARQQKEQMKDNRASDERGAINGFFNFLANKASGLERDGTRKDGGYKDVDTSDIIFVGNIPPEPPKL